MEGEVGKFVLITDGWFNQTAAAREYAVQAYINSVDILDVHTVDAGNVAVTSVGTDNVVVLASDVVDAVLVHGVVHTDGWFNQTAAAREYAVQAYIDGSLQNVNITNNGHLFIENNDGTNVVAVGGVVERLMVVTREVSLSAF